VDEGKENLENYIYFYPTAYNAFFRELEKRVAMQRGKDSDQIRALRDQLSQWTEMEKAEKFDPIFRERANPILEKIAVEQSTLEAALEQAEALAKGNEE
jgi:hypothetical protein